MEKQELDFYRTVTQRIAIGLAQEIDMLPRRDYQPRCKNTSRVLCIHLRNCNPAYLPKVKAMKNQLSMWAGLPEDYQVRIGHDHLSILIEVPKPSQFWKKVTIERLLVRRGPVATLGLGARDDHIVRLNFNEPAMAHILICGQTRSGKTTTQRLVAWNICHNVNQDEARLIIFDVVKKGFKWLDFESVSHLAHPLVTDLQEADRVLCWLVEEIDRRADQRYITPKLFVLIDELKSLADDSKVASQYLARIASVGGEFGIHLVLSTQYPQIKMLGDNAELKRNVTTRLCGRVDDNLAAYNALGLKDTGAESLGGYGDFLLKDSRSLSRLTVAKLGQYHVDDLTRSETSVLDLPDFNRVDNGPKVKQPDQITPEQVAVALFEPTGITKLATRLGIGSSKAKRAKRFAEGIRQWAIENDHNFIPNH